MVSGNQWQERDVSITGGKKLKTNNMERALLYNMSTTWVVFGVIMAYGVYLQWKEYRSNKKK